jgi:hypothetical protein
MLEGVQNRERFMTSLEVSEANPGVCNIFIAKVFTKLQIFSAEKICYEILAKVKDFCLARGKTIVETIYLTALINP